RVLHQAIPSVAARLRRSLVMTFVIVTAPIAPATAATKTRQPRDDASGAMETALALCADCISPVSDDRDDPPPLCFAATPAAAPCLEARPRSLDSAAVVGATGDAVVVVVGSVAETADGVTCCAVAPTGRGASTGQPVPKHRGIW